MYLTEEQTAFVDSIKKMVDRHIAPIAAEIDESDRFPEELVPIFGDMGLLQQWVPEEYGGPGGNLTLLCLAKHEIAKVSMACSILAGQNSIGMALPVLHFGTEEQKRRFLPLSAKGRTLTAVAMSEPHCGSDVAAMKTKAVRDGASYVINGQKCFITFGSVAHWVLLFARTSEGRGVDGISAFMVDTKTAGFKVGRNERKMGLGGVPNVQLFFENMRIPIENRLGEEGQGFKAYMHILNLNRPTVAAASIGLGQGALDAAITYAKERKAFGKAIASNQGLQWMIADMAIQLEAARALLFECTRQVDMGDFSQLSMMASMAKCFGSDVAMKVTTDAVQIFGGVGYLKDYPVERMMRDAKINQIWEGTNQIQRIVISRHLLGKSLMPKLKTLSDALDGIEDGASIGIGGWIFNSQPMALVRELIRRNKRNLRLVPAPGSIAPDMLIGAGCVAETGCVFISFEQFGLAPHFRRAAETGTIKIHELDGPAIAGGLRAAACDLPYGLIPDMCTDLPRVNPQTYQAVPRAPGERAMLKVPAIHLDVVLLHAQQADELGNVQYFGPVFFDVLMAQAAKKVIVSVDRIVPTEMIRRDNHLTKLPSAFVHSVVEAPFGAHPTSSGGLYEADDAHLAEYVKASSDAASFASYLERYVGGTPHDYHARIGSPQLRAAAVQP